MDQFFGLFILIINTAAFAAMGIDKFKACKGKWRISEKTLFLLAITGGALGIFIGMYFFHHKTRHWKFIFGIPFIFATQIVFLFWIWQLFSLW